MADFGAVRQAMALRAKYRVAKKRISLEHLAVHTKNRGGVYPNDDTVMNLALKILDQGCSVEEANHEGVCVQEMPSEERGIEPMPASGLSSQWRDYETYKEWNMRHCEGTAMECCFDVNSDILYGTLSHSHLLSSKTPKKEKPGAKGKEAGASKAGSIEI